MGRGVPSAVEYAVRVPIGLVAALALLWSALWLAAVVFDLLTPWRPRFLPRDRPLGSRALGGVGECEAAQSRQRIIQVGDERLV